MTPLRRRLWTSEQASRHISDSVQYLESTWDKFFSPIDIKLNGTPNFCQCRCPPLLSRLIILGHRSIKQITIEYPIGFTPVAIDIHQIGDDETSEGRTCIPINLIDEGLDGLTAKSLGRIFDAIYHV